MGVAKGTCLFASTAAIAALLTTNPTSAQCAPGYRCGPGTNYYPGPARPQYIPQPLPRPIIQGPNPYKYWGQKVILPH